jgi:hypothetical protein
MYTNSVILAAFASPCAHVSPWAAPVQGIRMSGPASALVSSVALDMAANRTKQDATGYPAFEDPL